MRTIASARSVALFECEDNETLIVGRKRLVVAAPAPTPENPARGVIVWCAPLACVHTCATVVAVIDDENETPAAATAAAAATPTVAARIGQVAVEVVLADGSRHRLRLRRPSSVFR